MEFAPEPSIYDSPDEAIWVLYDLRDPDAWIRAGEERRAWGLEHAEIFTLDNDHIVIVFQPRSARRPAA